MRYSAQPRSATQPKFEQSIPLNPSTQGSSHVPDKGQESNSLVKILENQNQLTSLLVKQQRLHSLPKGNITVFDGNILQYKSFIHSFEHIIENKTDNNQDRLQFLIQYTKGQAQELVKSCQHMDPNRGYGKARQLLKEHFGNEYKISCAYIEKALSWPTIRSEDSRALQDFALYLRGCCNAMEQLEYMEELDTSSNMRNIVLKLPYKLREKWRTKACEMQEQRSTRIRMADLVCFIERQTSIISDPVFGDIQDSSSTYKVKPKAPLKSHAKGSFATNVDVKLSEQIPRNTNNSCIFCNGSHVLESCSQFVTKEHREKIMFLKLNGICFGCLAKAGHVSKDCTKRLNCSTCNKQHPSVLHIRAKEATAHTIETPVSSMQVSLHAGGHSGTGNAQRYPKCMLSIVPVQVKSSKGSKIINTYAFLDPGSSATFCTENLMNKLNIT